MASSRGYASGLHATTDAGDAMLDQQPSNVDETEAMEVDQHPTSAMAIVGRWPHPGSSSSLLLSSDHTLNNLDQEALNQLLHFEPPSSSPQRERPCKASGSGQPSSSRAAVLSFPSVPSPSPFYCANGNSSRPSNIHASDQAWSPAVPTGDGGNAALTLFQAAAQHGSGSDPDAGPLASPPLPPPPPLALDGRSDSGRGEDAGAIVAAAAAAGAWRRQPQGPVGAAAPGGGVKLKYLESGREMGSGGGVNAAGIGGEEAGVKGPMEGPMEGPAPAPSEAQLAAVVAVRPLSPYMEYDPYAPGQAPLVSFYSYALTEGLDNDDDDDDEALDEGEGEDVEVEVIMSEGEEHGEAERVPRAEVEMDFEDMFGEAAGAGAGGSVSFQPNRVVAPERGQQVAPDGRSERAALRAAGGGGGGSGAVGLYDSIDLNDLEEMDDVDIDSDEDDDDDDRLLDGDAEDGGARAAAGAASNHAYRGMVPESAYGGAWARARPRNIPCHVQHHRHAHAAAGPRALSLYRRRAEAYTSRAKAVAAESKFSGGREGAASGSARAGSGANAAVAGTSTGAGPSNAGGSGSGNGWSLRYQLSPEFVSADPWSEDEEEETDTTAEQFYAANQPKDIQGIPWEQLHFNRSRYRETRLRQYRNYTNVLPDNNGGAYRAELAPLCAAPRRGGTAGVIGGDATNPAAAAAVRGPPFFSFVRNNRSVQSNIVHFQLRNLVWATSPNDVFVVHDNRVNHWNPVARTITEVMNLGGGGGGGGDGGAPRAGDESSRIQALGRVQVSTLCVSGDLVAAGGFLGELVVKRISGLPSPAGRSSTGVPGAATGLRGHGDGGPFAPAVAAPGAAGAAAVAGTRGGAGGIPARGAVLQGPMGHVRGGGASGGKQGGGGSLLYCARITSSDNGITNGLEIFNDRVHGTVIMSANNDQKLRLFAAALGEGTLRPLTQWPFDWAVNYATVRPDSHLAAVVGDDPDTLLTDVHNGTTVARLHGHQDFSFAAAWHPGGVLLATGNQDTTTLLWDVRKTNEPLTRLAGRMGAIRSLRFTPDGRFLAMSEPADFVHIYDVASGFQDCQEHDFFGEIAGIAFTPDSSSLFVGISDLVYASLMQLERQRCEWW
ncbi:hypothetical protein Vretimale_9993 [Volvox reticuliferus]|uniref:DUF2415 domain-containing protein n=1 Tax=Volvox reticuliferus TaxID=1737510 RepID=A0A8J4CYI2_9CHLO|nr:hypothetical protein Vretifemale_18853 [Volvox reticuliferus]GIM05531.1 hypothetical protein Vretimale_9993 [Volvox reticuliferus]